MAKKLFVGSLAWGTTDDSLKTLFSTVGNVVSAVVIQDKVSGRSRGFGFVEMSTDAEAEKAKNELNGKDLDGRAIMVSEARDREDRSDRPDSPKTEDVSNSQADDSQGSEPEGDQE